MEQYDKELLLHDTAGTPVTADSQSTGKAIALRRALKSKVKVHVKAADAASADETYVLYVEVSDLVGGTYTEVARVNIPRGDLGIYEMALSGKGVEKLDADSAFVRVRWDVGGTTPSLDFTAYVVPG